MKGKPILNGYLLLPSIFICFIVVYRFSISEDFSLISLIIAGISMIFIVIGSFLPTCSIDDTIGVKTRWALKSEENWNNTNKITGKVWLIFGLTGLISVLCRLESIIVLSISTIILFPIIYSVIKEKSK